MGAAGLIVVLVTAPPDAAGPLARELVRRRLAACANVVSGMNSVFWWDGDVQAEAESLLVLKTTVGSFDALRSAVVELHPYDVPEVIGLPVNVALKAYADWVSSEVEEPA